MGRFLKWPESHPKQKQPALHFAKCRLLFCLVCRLRFGRADHAALVGGVAVVLAALQSGFFGGRAAGEEAAGRSVGNIQFFGLLGFRQGNAAAVQPPSRQFAGLPPRAEVVHHVADIALADGGR